MTHGALVKATVRKSEGGGVRFRAGPGVGTATKPGLPIGPGEPAINPVPRRMIAGAIAEVAQAHGAGGDVEVEISIPGGEKLAEKTMNGRLGIVGGLSILGTTGIVVPYSCAACKLADGHTDLHSGRSSVDREGLVRRLAALGASEATLVQAEAAGSAGAILEVASEAGLPLADALAAEARAVAVAALAGARLTPHVDVLIVDRTGSIVGRAGP